MVQHKFCLQQSHLGLALAVCAVLALAAPRLSAADPESKIDVLHIGSSGSFTPGEAKEKDALKSLRDFIEHETHYKNDIHRQKNWAELADKMAKKELQIGVFQGYEFA